MMKVKSIIAAVVLAVAGLCFTGCNQDDSNYAWSCVADISEMIVVGNCVTPQWNNANGATLTSVGGGLYTATITATGTDAQFQLLHVGSWDGGFYSTSLTIGEDFKEMSKDKGNCVLAGTTDGASYKLTFKVEGLKVSVKAEAI